MAYLSRIFLLCILSLFMIGCSGEKVEITNFLKELEASNRRVEQISNELEAALLELTEASSKGEVDQAAWEKRLKDFSQRLKVEKESVAKLAAPEKAGGLHQVVLQEYNILIQMVEATTPMIAITAQLGEANREARKDPSKAKEIVERMRPVEVERKKAAAALERLTKEGKALEERARAEQQKIQDEFGIRIRAEKASGS